MSVTYEEYKTWLEVPIDPNVDRKYKAALELLAPRQILEDRLEADKDDKDVHLAVYKDYIDLELKEGNPVRIRSIYERRISDHCLKPLVWQEYSEYLEVKLKDLESSRDVLLRAVRNCNWSGDLWVRLLRCCERLCLPKTEICKHLEAGLIAGLAELSDFLNLWLAFLDYRRRHLKYDADDNVVEKDMDDLRAVFRQALEHLASVTGDPDCKVARYWANIEADQFRNMEQARQIWSEITMGPAGEKAHFWLEYIYLEKLFGDTKHLKKLFPKALAKSEDFPLMIGDMWIQFEREEGTLDSYEVAEKEITIRMSKVGAGADQHVVNKQQQQQQQQPNRYREINNKKSKDKSRDHTSGSQSMDRKRKQTPREKTNEEPVFKKPFVPTAAVSPSTSNSTATVKEEKVAPPPGFKSKPEDIAPPPGFKSEPENIAPPPGYKPPEPDSSSVGNERKVFVSNLDYKLSEEDLKAVLSSSGEIEEFNLVKTFDGKSKGFAYVKFKTYSAAQNALARDREPIGERPSKFGKHFSSIFLYV